MSKASFKIFDASAGSGKTYTLTKEYLKIILVSPKAFKRILAITFTNKAVNEMKHRILESLFQFTLIQNRDEASPMFLDVLADLNLKAEVLRSRAAIALKDILHNYAFFDISTIDKFTHRLIRTFARDLRLPQNFEVILDNDLLLEEAVARLIQKAGNDSQLTQVLIAFALEKVDGDKSWDILFDLKKIGLILFNETQALHVEELSDKNLDDFLELKKGILAKKVALEKEMASTASEALKLIMDNGLVFNNFYKSQFPNFMAEVKENSPKVNFNAKWKNDFESTPLYVQKCPDDIKAIIDRLESEFSSSLSLIRYTFYEVSFLKNAYTNIVPLTVLNAIHQEVKNIQEERNQISISQFNTIVSREIKDQPAPFIYERLGEKYRHYFIDEFQDTSEMQWNNLIPLIDNALASENGSLFLVGDAKQAIYRWRGGKAEQFLNLLGLKSNPFVIAPQMESLPKNYRSCEEIVRFNNSFFKSMGPFLNNTTYRNLFLNGTSQESNAQKGGLVQLTFLEKAKNTDLDTLYATKVLQHIQEVMEKGYSFGDICILTRKKKQGILLADFLMEHKIPIVSSETLLLKNNRKVRFLIHLLQFFNQPDNLETSYQILHFLAEDLQDKHTFIVKHVRNLKEFLRHEHDFQVEAFAKLSVYDCFEYAIRQFQLAKESNAYMINLLEFVWDVEQKEGAGISIFLNQWEKQQEKLNIAIPSINNAVQIMTIHKSKGLEFPIVIFPYANGKIYEEIDAKLWLPMKKKSFHGFSELLVNKKKEVIHYGDLAMKLYNQEQQQLELDAFNILYVVLTRAINGLYIISEMEIYAKGPFKSDNYSGLFLHFLTEKGMWQIDREQYLFGGLPSPGHTNKKEGSEDALTFAYSYKDRSNFKLLANSGMLWDTERETAILQGTLIHHVLGQIKVETDLEAVFDRLVQVGDLNKNQVIFLRDIITKVVHHPKLHRFYHDYEDITIKNEQDIILDNGSIVRPDRIVLKGDRATIIDYKTGRRKEVHDTQLTGYAQALEAMGYTVENKIIVYIDKKVTPEFI